MNRRTFLKAAGIGSIAFTAGCNAHPERHIFSQVRAPEDMVTGEATWYASTCRECPAGCGLLAKNREGRVIKLEGNPLHPVNQGRLCARGQAGLQGLYNPDRIQTPLIKFNGRWEPIALDRALATLRVRMFNAAANGPERIAMLTEVVGTPLLELFGTLLSHHRSQGPVIFEPLAYESLKYAHAQVLGQPIMPGYRLDQADIIVGFGADFLETWLSPVEYSRKFKAMHALRQGRKGEFIHVDTHPSLTAANADQWLACRPGSQSSLAMGLMREALARDRGRSLPSAVREALIRLSTRYTTEQVARDSDLPQDQIIHLSQRLLAAARPLVLPTSVTGGGSASTAADLATVWLNAVLDPTMSLYDMDRRHRVEIAQPRSAIARFFEKISAPPTELLLLDNVNPLYTLPLDPALAQALKRPELFVVAFSRSMDETAAAADLIIPIQHALESWDIYESRHTLVSTVQPTMGRINTIPNIGDLFLQSWPNRNRPAADYRGYIEQRLKQSGQIATQTDWLRLIQAGGRFDVPEPATKPLIQWDLRAVEALSQALDKVSFPQKAPSLVQVTTSLRYYDGRGADRPWLSEIPDPISHVAWQTLALIAESLMTTKGWSDGQVIKITTAYGQIRLPAYAHPGLHPQVVAIAMGQGHTQMGRYARNQGVNPLVLISAATDNPAGAPGFSAAIIDLSAVGPRQKIASVSGSRLQHDRKIALSLPLDQADQPEHQTPGLTMNDFPFTPPLPQGYDRHRDIYPAHDHETYRWGMVVDLDRCIGCSACVVACYAENSVAVVGEQQIIKGREMSWLRIERYQDTQDPTRSIFLPMLCQHCDNAPCEAVCPVYAPHHSKEGLNNQVYNRCIGTRFCAQNCPYKVRRFNWFDPQWPEPLAMQLNPNVTVRSKGVMEKCSFCVQRIKQAHDLAKNEQRLIRDGEVVPACVQTCPTDALVFGNLMDPDSVVRRKMADPRAYQVLGYLNTKPAVIYLKKIIQRT